MCADVMECDALARIRKETNENQARATSANHSAWVSANAGAGKTYVLVRRALSLLLAGSSPEAILCLTFTKAAAAEMANRLIAELGKWATAPDVWLRKTVENLNGRPATSSDVELARRLFAQVVETPGGLRIMTIHAFCDRVLRRFPLEAGVSPNFAILADEDAAILRGEAAEAVLEEASGQPHSVLGRSLLQIVAYANEEQFDGLLRAVLSNRGELKALVQQYGPGDPFEAADRSLRERLGVGARERRQDVLDAEWAICRREWLADAIACLAQGKATDQDLARKLTAARRAGSAFAAADALGGAFLSSERKARKGRFFTKAVRERCPDLARKLEEARDAFAALDARLCAVTAAEVTAALLRLADAIVSRYDAAKADRSCLDYDDLIAKTISLLTADGGSGWVLYRLDGGVDHILVDEAQDTSPAQWRVITELSSEFFSGQGAREEPRTIFAVGDEKQSIYSFQGAEPKRFAEMGEMFRSRSRSAGLPHCEAPLFLSFRSTEPVLRAVDLVFADETRTPGLSSVRRPVRHYADRRNGGGLVEVWPTIKAEKEETSDAWTPLDESGRQTKPCDLLAARIADQIKSWLDGKEFLPSRGRSIRPGDILILVKKREPFARPMIRALKDRGIPVAGADRMRLLAELAIQDLMSIGAFVLLPDDDLNLACLLKSPAFDFSDDDLFEIAHDRDGSLWTALRSRASERPRFAQAVERLRIWLNQADQVPPFEFYMERLEREELLAALLERLGAEASDAIGEFLDLALNYEKTAVPSLQGFLHWLAQNDIEIKRDMEQDRDEVRVMTVHGAKGLEADIVFLPDTCSTRGASRPSLILLEPEGGRPGAARQFLWTPAGCGGIGAAQAAREAMKTKEREEYHRLLYVAMTRARDRLYVAGFEGIRGRDAGCWHDLVRTGLLGVAAEDPDGILRLEESGFVPAQEAHDFSSAPSRATPPSWIAAPAPPEPLPAERMAATSSSFIIADAGGRQRRSSSAAGRETAIERGVMVHKLLELLSEAPPETWASAADRLVEAFGANISVSERKAVANSTLAILRSPDFSYLWAAESRAEVDLIAEFPSSTPGAPPLRLSGRVDRLAVVGDTVCIVDYKTGDAPPARLSDVPQNYLLQLAAYRLAIKAAFPEKSVRAALLWTAVPELMEVPETLLESLSLHWDADGLT
jgi:ATP-dependent helicase/nuclease subunit A